MPGGHDDGSQPSPHGTLRDRLVHLGRVLAPWRWQLWSAVVLAEALLTYGLLPADIRFFADAGRQLLHGDFAAVYGNSANQGGPLQLLVSWALMIGSSETSLLLPVFLLGNLGLLGSAYLVCRATRGGQPPPAGREAIVGAMVAMWLVPANFWTGHPAELGVPLLWAASGAASRSGRWLSSGVMIGLATLIAPWGILAAPVVLLSPTVARALGASVAGATVSVLGYLPFALSGDFQLIHHRWPIDAGSIVHELFPHLQYFGWDLRVVQAVLMAGSCALVVLYRRHDPQAIWLAPLAPALVRVLTDPLRFDYYWVPVGVLVLVGVALGAPRSRSRWSWVALAALVYLPCIATPESVWFIAALLCVAALATLVLDAETSSTLPRHRTFAGPSSVFAGSKDGQAP
jgi:hypothetical protein